MFRNNLFAAVMFFTCLLTSLPLFAGGSAEENILPEPEKSVINIAAAGNLAEIMPALNARYSRSHPGTELKVSLASTGKLTAQIINGAPFDILLGANTSYPDKIAEAGMAAMPPEVYAVGEIILFSRYGRGFPGGLNDLSNIETYRQVVIANPELAPYGKAALSALSSLGIELDSGRLLTAETVNQAATMAVTAADAGILAKSTIIRRPEFNAEGVYWISIPEHYYKPILQSMVVIKNAAWKSCPEALTSYRDFILSDEAADIFIGYGYSTVSGIGNR